MEVITLNGTARQNLGKTATKAVRNADLVPCVLYGGSEINHFTVEPLDLRPIIYTPEFKVIEIQLDGQTHRAILKDLQVHPVTERILHVDFLRLIDNHPVKVNVPVSFEGIAQGLKSGGKLIKKVRKVKIKALPNQLVDKVVLDTTEMGLGETQRIKDLRIPEGVEVLQNASIPLATIDVPRALRASAAEEAKAAGKDAKKK